MAEEADQRASDRERDEAVTGLQVAFAATAPVVHIRGLADKGLVEVCCARVPLQPADQPA